MASLWDQAKKKLQIIRQYLKLSVPVGFILALISILYISMFSISTISLQLFLLMWLIWSFDMAFVLPAVLCDEFSLPNNL